MGGAPAARSCLGAQTLCSAPCPPPKNHIPHPLSRGFVGLWLLFVGFCGWDMAPGHPGQQLFHLTGHNLGSPPAQPRSGDEGEPLHPQQQGCEVHFSLKNEEKSQTREPGGTSMGSISSQPWIRRALSAFLAKKPQTHPKTRTDAPVAAYSGKIGEEKAIFGTVVYGDLTQQLYFFLNPLFAGRGGRDPALKSRAMGLGFPMGTPPAPCCLSPPQ